MGDRTLHLELTVSNEHTGLQQRPKGELGPTPWAESLDPAGPAIAGPTHLVSTPAVRTKTLVLGHLRIIKHGRCLINYRHLGQAAQRVPAGLAGHKLGRHWTYGGLDPDRHHQARREHRQRAHGNSTPGAITIITNRRTAGGTTLILMVCNLDCI
jgi:hypothetical protein